MLSANLDSYRTLAAFDRNGVPYHYFSLRALAQKFPNVDRLPVTLKVLLENLLRNEDGVSVTAEDIAALAQWSPGGEEREVAFSPARVLMQDLSAVPAIVDLAAMRDAMTRLGGDAARINPLSPVDIVIDHSVMVDRFGSDKALAENVAIEFQRNQERYSFMRWAQTAFDNVRIVPPGTGICHQVNIEYLAKTVWTQTVNGKTYAYPDTVVGTDSHTTMVNGMAVLGWGVGGIEAEAAMLGQPISMLVPDVVGVRLTGRPREGITATDIVLVVTQVLRATGVVGRFVEFFGDGASNLPLADRATIANMAPEYGATCGFFAVDNETLNYLRLTGRPDDQVDLVETYSRLQGLWRDAGDPEPIFTKVVEIDMSAIEPAMAGPKRPQDRVLLSNVKSAFHEIAPVSAAVRADEERTDLRHGDIVIAAITSCTNTSNPSVMIAAGLVARNANRLGLTRKPWVKTSLAPGSQVVSGYLENSGLQEHLDAIGFNVVGFGCTTCIGNSGPLLDDVAEEIDEKDLTAVAVLSGNRNFEGRIHTHIKANYLASPPLVVAYALAGSINIDLMTEPLGVSREGEPVYLRDIWPSAEEIRAVERQTLGPELFNSRYSNVLEGPEEWRKIKVGKSLNYKWDIGSTYVREAPYLADMPLVAPPVIDIHKARVLAVLGDSVTTDHISPASSIPESTPAGRFLLDHQIPAREFNSYGTRRGNFEVMQRATFANIRLRNEMAPDTSGGQTRHMPSGDAMTIYDASVRYREEGVPLVVIAGKEYGTGSSRDWAAKGPVLLGVRAVIAESFERIHRSNLIGMGVLALEFKNGANRHSLGIDGSELFDITGIGERIEPRMDLECRITRTDGTVDIVPLLCRIDTVQEVQYYREGGILPYVLRSMIGGGRSKAA